MLGPDQLVASNASLPNRRCSGRPETPFQACAAVNKTGAHSWGGKGVARRIGFEAFPAAHGLALLSEPRTLFPHAAGRASGDEAQIGRGSWRGRREISV